MLLSNCQTVLENADQPDMLTAVVDILAYVGHVYVSAFASHFMVSALLFIVSATAAQVVLSCHDNCCVAITTGHSRHPCWLVH